MSKNWEGDDQKSLKFGLKYKTNKRHPQKRKLIKYFLDTYDAIPVRNLLDVIVVEDIFQDPIIYGRIEELIRMRNHINALYVPMQR